MPRKKLEDIGQVAVTFRRGIPAEERAWELLQPIIQAGGGRQFIRSLVVRELVPEAFGAHPVLRADLGKEEADE